MVRPGDDGEIGLVKFRHWRRWLFRQLVRLRGTPYAAARGMALGVIVGCVLPPGFQAVTVVPLALLLSADPLLAYAGTWVSNPLTYGPLYIFTCKVGELFLRLCGSAERLRAVEAVGHMLEFNWSGLGEQLGLFLSCWVIGGLIVGLAGSVPTYYLTYVAVVEMRKLREYRRARRAERRAELEAEPSPAPPPPDEPDEEAPDEEPPPPPD
jgi:hypothetical protein